MNTNGGFLITKVKQLSDRVFEKILSEKNIDAFNGAQGRILYVLWQEDGIPIKALSDLCGLAITSLTSMLERMEKQGLITRVQDEKDKRKTLLFLTDTARGLKRDYDAVSGQMGQIFYRDFSDEDIERFESYLNRIRTNLERWRPKTAAPRDDRNAMMREFWRRRFLELDQEELIRRFSLESDAGQIRISYYGRHYAVDRATGSILSCDAPQETVEFGPLMAIYHLFWYSKPDAANTGRFVPFRELKNASQFSSAFEKTVATELATPFDGHLEALHRACEALSGEPIEQGDAGYVFHAFDCMPVMMVFWNGDEEFSAQANLLFDVSITDFTHVETVCAVAGDLMRRLRELAGLA
ncbi:MAG: radical SAM mobile pair system MarR family transcriptional regulator [Oscillospiraceae bacterium]|nr:radical SAM mobile pair system MarR family transcriptional regulator [Oscillospiraceae bacterium]